MFRFCFCWGRWLYLIVGKSVQGHEDNCNGAKNTCQLKGLLSAYLIHSSLKLHQMEHRYNSESD